MLSPDVFDPLIVVVVHLPSSFVSCMKDRRKPLFGASPQCGRRCGVSIMIIVWPCWDQKLLEFHLPSISASISASPCLAAYVVHPRYAIYVSGCSSTNYGVIGESDRELYRQLLRSNDFLHEHPRPETIPKVMAQKPVFALGSNSYSWVDSDVLNPKDSAATYDEDDETFFIDQYDEADSPM